MRLKRVHLCPFAGQADREIHFEPGLNVILGPNEAGKSTLFHAIQHVLFTQTNLKKLDFKKEIQRFLPIDGGDTVTVELDLEYADEAYVIRRTWGATKLTELKLPGGSLVTDEKKVTEHLKEILPANKGTFSSTLMASQSGLAHIIDELKTQSDSIQSLGAILRRSVFETDGISVEQFRDQIEEQFGRFFSRWNREDQCPEERGTRFQRGVGEILGAYYKLEDGRQALEDAHRYEETLSEINQRIEKCLHGILEGEEFVKNNQKAVGDASERQLLESRLESVRTRVTGLQKDNAEWPVIEDKAREIRGKLPGLRKQREALEDESRKTREWEQQRERHEQFIKVQGLKKRIEEAEKQLEGMPKVTSEDIGALRELDVALKELKAGMTAGKINLKFVSKKDISVSVQQDFEDQREENLQIGTPLILSAEGRLLLDHPDWGLEITSGEDDFEGKSSQYKQISAQFQQALDDCGVDNLAKAENLHTQYEEACRQMNDARFRFEEELGTETWEELSDFEQGFGEVKDLRNFIDVVQDLEAFKRKLEKEEEKLEGYEERLSELQAQYNNQEELLITVSGIVRERRDMEEQIALLAPLPEGIEVVDAFLDEFNKRKLELEVARELRNELIIERKEHEKSEPEISAEELERQVPEIEDAFKRVLRQGEAVGRVYDVAKNLVEEMDSKTFKGLETGLVRYVSNMTEDRYTAIDMEESLPRGFVRQDGHVLPYNLLSTGTKDVLGLSLRLAMAEHFLQDADGFLALDDPLVELDPRRQERGARILADFAKERQVLLFTCQPQHAKLLAGNRIDL